jgi:hypothetical protein
MRGSGTTLPKQQDSIAFSRPIVIPSCIMGRCSFVMEA